MNTAIMNLEAPKVGDVIKVELFIWDARSGGRGFIKWYYSTEIHEGVFKRETEKAILISVAGKGDLWIPKSKLKRDIVTNIFRVCDKFCKYARMQGGFPKWLPIK